MASTDHTPRLCPHCEYPLTAKLHCTRCGEDWAPVPDFQASSKKLQPLGVQASLGDACAVCELAQRELGRKLDPHRVFALLEPYPAALIWADGRLVGFIFGSLVSPDIIQIANLLVASEHRQRGLGARLVASFEQQAAEKYDAILVSTSTLWLSHGEEKASAAPFYRRLGYIPIYETPSTSVLIKEL